MYASLKSRKCDLNIKVLNRMSPLALYVSCDSSFISTQFFVLNLDGWFVVWSKKLLFFEILLLSYYINLRSLIICFLFSGDIYLSLLSPIFSPSFVTVSELLWLSVWDFRNSIRNFITNQVTSCFCWFLNCSFWSSFERICSKCFSMVKKFLTIFTAWVFTYIFTNIATNIFSKIQKSINYRSLGGTE